MVYYRALKVISSLVTINAILIVQELHMSLVVEDLIHALPVQQDVLFVQKTEQIPIAVNARLMVVLNTIFY